MMGTGGDVPEKLFRAGSRLAFDKDRRKFFQEHGRKPAGKQKSPRKKGKQSKPGKKSKNSKQSKKGKQDAQDGEKPRQPRVVR